MILYLSFHYEYLAIFTTNAYPLLHTYIVIIDVIIHIIIRIIVVIVIEK